MSLFVCSTSNAAGPTHALYFIEKTIKIVWVFKVDGWQGGKTALWCELVHMFVCVCAVCVFGR